MSRDRALRCEMSASKARAGSPVEIDTWAGATRRWPTRGDHSTTRAPGAWSKECAQAVAQKTRFVGRRLSGIVSPLIKRNANRFLVVEDPAARSSYPIHLLDAEYKNRRSHSGAARFNPAEPQGAPRDRRTPHGGMGVARGARFRPDGPRAGGDRFGRGDVGLPTARNSRSDDVTGVRERVGPGKRSGAPGRCRHLRQYSG